QDVLARLGRIFQSTHGQLGRFLREVDHALGIHLLDVPEIQCVVWTEELVSGAFTPTVVGDFIATHEVFAGEDGMFLVPDESLRKVQAACLKHRRVVAEVAVAAPNIERATGKEHASEVSKPGIQQTVKLLLGDEVIGQGAVFGPHLGNGGSSLLERSESS